MKTIRRRAWTLLAAVLLVAGIGDAQHPPAPGQILGVTGDGRYAVTSTGDLTPNDCVKIDSTGNYVAAGAACGGGGGGLTSPWSQSSQTITGAATAILDLGAGAGIKPPASAGCVATATNRVCIDTTSGKLHVWDPVAGADSTIVTTGAVSAAAVGAGVLRQAASVGGAPPVLASAELSGIISTSGSNVTAWVAGGALNNPTLGTGYLSTTKTASTAGTTASLLSCFDGTTGNVIDCPTSSVGALGISVTTATSTNPVQVATRGIINCVADGTTTVGNLLGVGTSTAGRCKDLGQSASTSVSSSLQIVGKALTSSGGAGNNVSVQLYGPGHYGALINLSNPTGSLALTNLAAQAANTTVANATSGSAVPTAIALPAGGTNGCSGSSDKPIYTAGTGWGCGTDGGGAGSGGGAIAYSATSITLVGATTYFMPFGGGNPANATEANVKTFVQSTATLSNFYFASNVAPGGSDTLIMTLRENGSNTAITCTITGAALSCVDSTHSIVTVAGRYYTVSVVGTAATVVTPILTYNLQFGTTNDNGTVNTGTAPALAAYLTSGTAVSNLTAHPRILSSVKTSGTTYTTGATTHLIRVRGCGGGGAGGGAALTSGNVSEGGGGGGGGYFEDWITPNTVSEAFTYAIGAAGAGSSGAAGGNGGNTTFATGASDSPASTTYTGVGGTGGTFVAAGTARYAAGGAGGIPTSTGSVGILLPGAPGAATSVLNGLGGTAGNGGGGWEGKGGALGSISNGTGNVEVVGVAGGGYCAGASGAFHLATQGAAIAGAAGSAGVLIVEEYY